MNVGFAGTPAFAASALQALLDAGFPVSLVLTQPDRPRGRGQKLEPGPVKRIALEAGIPVFQPQSLANDPLRAPLFASAIDVLVVASYGLLLPPAVLAWPRQGCVNVHASLLPRWRGAAPIQRALLAGDAQSGVTLMRMDAGLDTGPMLDAVTVAVSSRETAGSLEHKLAAQGARLLVAYLHRRATGAPDAPIAQPADGATYAAKVRKAEAEIDWRAAAVTIDRQVRAFDPAPGASTSLYGEKIKLWRAEPAAIEARGAAPGAVLAMDGASLVVACGEGALRVDELQPAGGRRMSAGAFVAGRHVASGARFGVSACAKHNE